MEHNSLYRKYRPRSFAEVIGQPHVVRILTNQILNDTVGHCYLFTGTRGIGKTSVAKIFAKAVNCLHPLKDGSPCGECEACRALSDEANLDVVELDAASNNSVDEIRAIIDQTAYQPQTVKYKVFIIDEVHMLTASAFNAFLKTLEEPPSYCIFILATTEQHKLPQTIVSRCLVMDFRLVGHALLVGILRHIFDDMGITYEDAALNLIADLGEGSVRDALSIADTCLSYSGKNISYSDVTEVLGISNPETVLQLVDAMLSSDYSGALKTVATLNASGKPMLTLYNEIVSALSDLIYIKSGYTVVADGMQESVRGLYYGLAERNPMDRLVRAIDIFVAAEGQLRYAVSSRILLETLIMRVADVRTELSADKLIHRIKALEQRLEDLSIGQVAAPIPSATAVSQSASSVAATQSTSKGVVGEAATTAQPEQKTAPTSPREVPPPQPMQAISAFVYHLNSIKRSSMLAMVFDDVVEASFSGNVFTVVVKTAIAESTLNDERNGSQLLAFLRDLYHNSVLSLRVISKEGEIQQALSEVDKIFGCKTIIE